MELRHIRYFLAVADTLSFTRAAELLNMAQPPLSRQIRALEDELGTELFRRGQRPLVLTPAGVALRAEARDILGRLGGLRGRIREAAGAEAPSLTIGFVSAAGSGLLPALARQFRRDHPEIRLHVRCLTNREQAEALREGTIALGLAWLPFELEEASALPLAEDRFCIAVPAEHPLATVERITPAMLETQTILFGCRTPSVGSKILALVENASEISAVGDLGTAIDGVAANLGLAIVPAALRPVRDGQVVYREFVNDTRLTIGAVTLDTAPEGATARFLDCARRAREAGRASGVGPFARVATDPVA